jgi:D-amino peptidase
MKVLVSVDIEGIAGVVHPDHARPGNADDERARRWMTAEANAAIAGARAGGATDVIVNDSHGDFRNLLAEDIDRSVRLLQGKPRELGMMAGMDDGCIAVFLVGWHAKAMASGVLAHTINGTAFARVLVNGDEVGELALYGGVAAEFGAPVAFVSGDDHCVAEASGLFPNAVGVSVKTAHGHRSATSLPPAAACAAIEAGARTAAQRIATLRISPQRTPPTVRVQASNPAFADLFSMLPLVRRIDAVTLEFASPTMRHAVRVLNSLSAMSFMLR